MRVSTSRPFNKWNVRAFQLALVLAIGFTVSSLSAQDSTSDSDRESFDQAKVVRAIYDATKTAKTVKEFTAFLTQCENALAAELSPENRSYVVSLKGWGLNRRGEKRFEMAVQLKRIENNQHESVMKLAMEDFDAALIAAPERVRSWMSRGIAHVENNNLDNAILDFTKVTKLKADEANGWFNRAEILYQKGNFDAAIQDYDVVLRLNSTDAQALTGRGLAAFAKGEFDKALSDFDQVVRSHPKNDSAFINRGDAYQGLGKWKLAQSDYEQAIEIRESGAAYQRCAWLKATCPDPKLRDAHTARKMVDRAIALAGYSASNLDTLAAAEAANGDFDSAKTTQQKVIGLVNAEEDEQSEQFQARLLLYEKSEPFVQLLGSDANGNLEANADAESPEKKQTDRDSKSDQR